MEQKPSAGPDAILKIKMVGDSAVGKTSIVIRYVENKFYDNLQATIGVDYKNVVKTMKGTNIKILLWDTAGQEKYRTLTFSYYKGTHGLCFVYDVSNKESFEHLDIWLDEFEQNSTEPEKVVKLLIANKIDLPERKVTQAEGQEYARKHSMLYAETSAKTDNGVTDAILTLCCTIMENNPAVLNPGSTPGAADKVQLTEEKKPSENSGKSCCG